jgi:hypothetical protein
MAKDKLKFLYILWAIFVSYIGKLMKISSNKLIKVVISCFHKIYISRQAQISQSKQAHIMYTFALKFWESINEAFWFVKFESNHYYPSIVGGTLASIFVMHFGLAFRYIIYLCWLSLSILSMVVKFKNLGKLVEARFTNP